MKLLYDFLFVVGMLFLSTYIYILFKSKEKGAAKLILIIFFTILLFVALESYSSLHNISILHHISFVPAHSSKLSIAPLLLLYIRSLFHDDETLLKNNIVYFIPFFLFALLVSTPYLIGKISQQYFLDYVSFIQENWQHIRLVLDLIFLFIIIKSFYTFFKLKHIVKCNYSHIAYNNFIWVRYLLIAVFIIISVDLLFVIGQLFFNMFSWRTQNLVISLMVISIIYMAYYGIKQSKVLVPYFLLDKENVTGNNNRVFTDVQKDEFAKLELSLNKVIHEQKPFLDEELTLNKLASIMDVTDKKLSTLLNQHIDTTFYKFVNNFRLEEFKRRIQSNSYKDLTIEGIAYDCGFKSKASFYRLFKKETAQSPSEFKSNLK